MVKLPKIPDTPEDFNNIVTYLQSGTPPAICSTSGKIQQFRKRCKDLVYDDNSGYLFYVRPPKDENSPPIKKRVVPMYDMNLRETLFEKFHTAGSHFSYHKTYKMLYEEHIGITQEEIEKYVRNCPTCIRNTSIKEKTDLTPVVAYGPLQHIQIDLVDLLSFAEHNDGYSYVLTMIDVFSRYVWAIPLKNKEGRTIHKKLVKFFQNFGPPNILHADNGSEFVTDVLNRTCKTLKVLIFSFCFLVSLSYFIFVFR